MKILKGKLTKNIFDESGIRTHASEDTSALNWRLRPLGHLAMPQANIYYLTNSDQIKKIFFYMFYVNQTC
uniref:Uncharacterized protein n=1 Tax=Strongyloides papillosus TaxID=174720 RepID=A0A0N5CHZ8_STREA